MLMSISQDREAFRGNASSGKSREVSMSGNIWLVQRAVLAVVFGLGLVGFYGRLDLAAQEKTALSSQEHRPQVINVKELSPEQFHELFPTWPDDTVLESDGKRITVGELRNKAEQRQAIVRAEMEKSIQKGAAALERRRAQFREREKTRLEARNKATMTEFQHLRKPSPQLQSELQVIRREFLSLQGRWTKASPAEQEEILRRADELVHKYNQLSPPTAQ
jgi:hypothetical protein